MYKVCKKRANEHRKFKLKSIMTSSTFLFDLALTIVAYWVRYDNTHTHI